MELKEAIELLADLIDGNKARLSTVIHIYDRECIVLDTVLQALENSIPKQVIEEKIKELDIKITYIESQYTNGGQNCDSNYLSALYQKQVLQDILEGE